MEKALANRGREARKKIGNDLSGVERRQRRRW
jgi:hypothetical protein